MITYNRYNLLLQLLDLAEQAGPQHEEFTLYLIETFLPAVAPERLNEAGDNLGGALKQLMAKTKETAHRAGGHVVDNLKAMFKQSAQAYAQATSDSDTPKKLAQSSRTEAGMIAAISLLMLGSAIATAGYGKDQAKKVVAQAAAHFAQANSTPYERGAGDDLKPTQAGQGVEPTHTQNPNQAQHQVESYIRPITEDSLDLMHLPGDVVAWLYDRPEDQMKTAKEIGVAAAEVGNPIAFGCALRSDHNVLLLKDQAGKGRFHVYPDGSMSFNGEMVDGHEDVERLIGVQPEQHEAPIAAMPVEPAIVGQAPEEMEQFAQPEQGDAGMPEEPDHLMITHGIRGVMRIEGLDVEDLLGEAGVADKFKKIKHKVQKMNPKAKTPKLDHTIKMWDKIEEGAIGDRVEWSNLRGDTFTGRIIALKGTDAQVERENGDICTISLEGISEDVLAEAMSTLTFLKNVRHDFSLSGKSTKKLDDTIAAIESIAK